MGPVSPMLFQLDSNRFVMLRRLTPNIERLCSMAEVAGGRMSKAPRVISSMDKPRRTTEPFFVKWASNEKRTFEVYAKIRPSKTGGAVCTHGKQSNALWIL